MSSLYEILNESPNLNVTINAGQLKECIDYAVQKTRRELEEHVINEKTEKFFTAEQTAEMLGTTKVTMWRWGKQGYLVPRRIGGMIRYSSFDVQRILKGG